MALLLLQVLLCFVAALPGTHALRNHPVLSGQPDPAAWTHSDTGLKLGLRSARDAISASHRRALMHHVEPVDISDAVVTEPVPARLLASLMHDPWYAHAGSVSSTAGGAIGAQRALLHGTRPAWKYAVCNQCTIVSCNAARTCSGHCKKNGKLFFCSQKNVPAGFCIPPPAGTPPPSSPDPLQTYDTVVVTAPAPYIGCANIANRPTGCPASFTGGATADGDAVTVVRSKCLAEGFMPECGSPYFPFGICECTLWVSGVGIVNQPCNTSELTLGVHSRFPDGPSTNEDGVVVDERGRITYTGFSDYTDADDEPEYKYNVTVTADGQNTTVFMDFYRTDVLLAEDLSEEGEVSDDYDYGEFSTY